MDKKWYVIKYKDDAFFGRTDGLCYAEVHSVYARPADAAKAVRDMKEESNVWYLVKDRVPFLYKYTFRYDEEGMEKHWIVGHPKEE